MSQGRGRPMKSFLLLRLATLSRPPRLRVRPEAAIGNRSRIQVVARVCREPETSVVDGDED
jgi:hypothetical protein